jgi:tRNA-modifying protein YgfZ
MTGERAEDRRVYEITGRDRIGFLQGLVTNDLGRLEKGIVYAALLTPQGKYLADFFLAPWGEAVLLDVRDTLADDLLRRLTMYKLRADVHIAPSALNVLRGLGEPPRDAFADPRHPSLGWRRYSDEPGDAPSIDWDALRVAACIPESGIELIPEQTFILEAGFDRLDGVDHRKGCYVGQEVTARMKHKIELRKGLTTVRVEGDAPQGSEITADGKQVGVLYTRAGDRAIAFLRFDRAGKDMHAGNAVVRLAG